MKTVFAAISVAFVGAGMATSPAMCLPRLTSDSTPETTMPAVEKARVVCNYRRCWHVGGYRYYRPYGYYRPYYGPRFGVGVGPFGVRIF